MNIIRRRGWEVPESQVTPERFFLNRRALHGRRVAARLDLIAATCRRAACLRCRQSARSDRRSLSGQGQHHLSGRPAADRREGRDHLQQFLRVRRRQGDRAARAGAEDQALDGQDRRHGGKAVRDRRRRSDPQDAAGGARLPAALRRSLEHDDSVDRLSAGEAGRTRQAACRLRNICRWKPSRIRRWRPASVRPGIRGLTPKASPSRRRTTISPSWSPASTASPRRARWARRSGSRCRGNTASSR